MTIYDEIASEIETECEKLLELKNISLLMKLCDIQSDNLEENTLCLYGFIDYLSIHKEEIVWKILCTAKLYSLQSFSYGAYFGKRALNPSIVLQTCSGDMYPIFVCYLDDSGLFVSIN